MFCDLDLFPSLITDRRRDNTSTPPPNNITYHFPLSQTSNNIDGAALFTVQLPFSSLSKFRVITYLYCFFRYRVHVHSDDAVKITRTERRTNVSVYKTVSHVLRGDEEISTTEDFDQWVKSITRTTNKPNCVPCCCLLCATTLLSLWVEHFCRWLFCFSQPFPYFRLLCRSSTVVQNTSHLIK